MEVSPLFAFFTKVLQPLGFLLYLIGLHVYRRHTQRKKETRVLFNYYLITTFLHFVIAVCSAFFIIKQNNIWMYELAALLSVLCISYHFYTLLEGEKKKRMIVFLTGLYILYAIVRQITINSPRLFDSIGYSLLSASVATYVFMYFHQILKNVTEASILKDFNFWLSSSYLLYFVGSFIIFVNYHHLTNQILKTYTSEERHLLMALWGLHNVLLFLSALSLLTGSLWISYRRKLA